MTALTWVAAFVSASLLVYLFVALLEPEPF